MLRVARLMATAALVLALGMAAAMIAAPLAGFERYVITGDSMAGSYDRGTLVFAERVQVSELGTGDVITYDPPRGKGPQGLVTHRIVSIRDRGDDSVIRTKGDANAHADPWRFTLAADQQPRAVIGIPYAGFVLAVLSIRWVRIALIGIPALAIAVVLLGGLWRDTGARVREAAR